MKLWGGRFSQELDPDAWQLNASIQFDQRLARQDVRGSQAWAEALKKAGLLSVEEHRQIFKGLEAIDSEFKEQRFAFKDSDEDIHTAVERRLQEMIGHAAGKLHTGRSRNDQVTTDLRLNEPRYVTLPNIMKAKKKSLEIVKPETLGVDVAPRLVTLKVAEPSKRKAGVKLPDAKALVDKLRNEAKVI